MNDIADLKKKVKRSKSIVTTILDDDSLLKPVDLYVSTGCVPLNLLISGRLDGGYPVGRYTEIFGDNSTGKSLLAMQATAEAQQMGAVTLYADAEYALSPDLMVKLGIDMDTLFHFVPETVSEVFDELIRIIDHKDEVLGVDCPMLFVWDSVASVTTEDERDTVAKEGLNKKSFSQKAIQISKAMRIYGSRIAKSNVCCIFINQTRSSMAMYGPKFSMDGGKTIGFYSSIRLRLKQRQKYVDEKTGDPYGVQMEVHTYKNKITAPFKTLNVPVLFGIGTDDMGPMLDTLMKYGIVTKAGGWYTTHFPDEPKKFQLSGFDDMLMENETQLMEMLMKVIEEGS